MEVLVGQVNFRGSLPRSASDVLEPMLHPGKRNMKKLSFKYFVISLTIPKLLSDTLKIQFLEELLSMNGLCMAWGLLACLCFS